MKIRNGFVTNSSSSSFLVSFKDGTLNRVPKELEEKLPELKFFQDFLQESLLKCEWTDDSDRTEHLTCIDEYDDLIRENYCTYSYSFPNGLNDYYAQNPELKKTRDRIEKALSEGKTVYYYMVPYSKKIKRNVIRLFIDQKLFEPLDEEREY